jgi:thymidylate synthase
MPELHVPDMRNGYVDVVEWVWREGKPVAPRGMETLEITNAMIHVADPYDCLPVGIGRKNYSTRFAACEAAQLVGGVSDVKLTLRINPNMEQFLDDGKFHGAYGPRVRYALRNAVRKLQIDPDTRQAVVPIFREDDVKFTWRDVPCTLNLHLSIRDGRLHLTTHMRSNDVWWGLGYDAFQFTQLQLTVANVINVPVGTYTHVADSLHLYERDFEAVRRLYKTRDPSIEAVYPRGFYGDDINEAQLTARRIITDSLRDEPNASEMWYLQRLHG